MGRSTTFDHTADLGLRVGAADLDDLFQTAAEALFGVIVIHRELIAPQQSADIAIIADSLDTLLVDWLNELIFRSETEHLVFGRFEVHVDPDALALRARAWGEPLDPDRHGRDHEVKAATHHGLRLDRVGEEWIAEVILDI